MPKTFDISTILMPQQVDVFMSDYWEKRPLLVSRGQPGFYRDLFSSSDMDLLIYNLKYPEIRVVKDGGEIPIDQYTDRIPLNGGMIDGMVAADKLVNEFCQGGTIILEGMHRKWEPLSSLCLSIERELKIPVQTNIYYTPPMSQGFSAHYDSHDVVIIQLEGTKHWRIYSPTIELPLPAQKFSSKESLKHLDHPIMEFDLCAGDCLYMPRGFVHEGEASEEASLHITVGLITYSWKHLIAELVNAASVDDVEFRRMVPLSGASDDGSRSELWRHCQSLFEKLGSRDDFAVVLDSVTERVCTSRPWVTVSPLRNARSIGQITNSTIVSAPNHKYFDAKVEHNEIIISFGGKRIYINQESAPEICFILGQESSFSVGSITGTLIEEEKLKLVRQLAKDGFLQVEEF